MTKVISFYTTILIGVLVLGACSSDTSLPTLRPTVDSGSTEPTVDPNLGTGFDPELGGDDPTNEVLPTPTRESGSVIEGDSESGARGIGFTAQITGGSIETVADGGLYACNLSGHRIASGNNPAPNITFTIPTVNTAGTHTLPNNNVTVSVSLQSVDDSYNQVTGGSVTIDDVPVESGDFVSGEFDFTVTNDAGNEIGVRGNFEFETSNTAYC